MKLAASPLHTFMGAFREWLLIEERQIIDPVVMQSYDREYERQLDLLIKRTRDPELKRTFQAMRPCPLEDSRGTCYTISGWIANSLLRNGCYTRIDAEEALNYVAFRLLSPVGEKGLPRRSAFDFDETRPYQPGTNPLAARIKTFIVRDIRNICGNRVPKLRNVYRPAGTLTIAQRRTKGEPSAGMVAAEEIPARPESGEREMVDDIMAVLRSRSTTELPLVALFQSVIQGEGTRVQRKKFGHTACDVGRKMIYDLIGQYAQKTGNYALLNLLNRYRNVDGAALAPNARRSRHRANRPRAEVQLPPDVRDYLSIISVIQGAGGRASMALLGKKRRRWLERKPRNEGSPHKTRLHDVLANMVADTVLVRQGAGYLLGPGAEKYLNFNQGQVEEQ